MTESPLRATVTLRGVLRDHDDQVLVLCRSTDGEWELPGGRLESEEAPVDGLRREIREETGIDPTIGEPAHSHAWRNDRDAGRFAVYYRCACARQDVSLSPEHDAFEWRTPRRARERLSAVQGRAVARAMPELQRVRSRQ